MFQMCKILSIDTESEADFKKSAVNTSELTGLEAFAFGYDVQWPLSLILNRLLSFLLISRVFLFKSLGNILISRIFFPHLYRTSLAQYQMLLRHLLHCKHVERLLTNVWITTKIFKTDTSNIYLTSLGNK